MFDPHDFPAPAVVQVNGIELEVFEAGRENAGNPIVLCHGWPEHAFSWRHRIPALVDAGYHVIVPNQRGYGHSSRPAEVSAYDIEHLTGDLVALLDHYGYADAVFAGHDWGAMVVWCLALLHPTRVTGVIALSLSYPERGDKPWVEFLEEMFRPDYHFVQFDRHPGVAAGVFDADPHRFLRNLFRTGEPRPGRPIIELAALGTPPGEPVLTDRELAVFVTAFETSGFTGGINWYRNTDRAWHLLADVDPVVRRPALLLYGARDTVRPTENLARFVPGIEVVELDGGHWIQQEKPQETTRAMLTWLAGRA